jgi:hypothetical protein
MNPIINPFAPGAGNRPPALAGRSEILKKAEIALQRMQAGFIERGPMIVGLSSVGKTVLLVEICRRAERLGCKAVICEAEESSNVARLLVPALRKVLFSLNTGAAWGDKVRRAMRVLKSFLSGLKVGVGDIEIGWEEPSERGVADSGLLELDLSDVFLAVGEAAKEAKTGVVIVIDELQYLKEEELGALIMAIHKVSQAALPLILVGAGLPQLTANMGRAKSYAERLFAFMPIGALEKPDALFAIQEPARQQGVRFLKDALDEVYKKTKGYPYFLQEWGFQAWNAASKSPIDFADIQRASKAAIQNLDESFFRVRFDRLTQREQDYLHALAKLGEGSKRSGDVAQILKTKSSAVAPLRAGLIAKGMVYSPRHGETAFTVPLFDEFMKRAMG